MEEQTLRAILCLLDFVGVMTAMCGSQLIQERNKAHVQDNICVCLPFATGKHGCHDFGTDEHHGSVAEAAIAFQVKLLHHLQMAKPACEKSPEAQLQRRFICCGFLKGHLSGVCFGLSGLGVVGALAVRRLGQTRFPKQL